MATSTNEDGTQTIELDVQGMHCGSCSALIEETLIEDPRIPAVFVDLAAERATVTFNPSAVSVDDLCAAIGELGYQAVPAS